MTEHFYPILELEVSACPFLRMCNGGGRGTSGRGHINN